MIKKSANVSNEQVIEFIKKHENWITKQRKQKSDQKIKSDNFLKTDHFILLGEKFEIKENGNNAIDKKNNVIYTKSDIKTNKAIITKLKQFADERLKERLNLWSIKTNLPYSNFKITNARRKWGSCDSHNSIMLNWRMIFLPQNLLNYVIIHELCHTKHKNHQKLFWDYVSKFDINFKANKTQLKQYNFLQDAFRI